MKDTKKNDQNSAYGSLQTSNRDSAHACRVTILLYPSPPFLYARFFSVMFSTVLAFSLGYANKM